MPGSANQKIKLLYLNDILLRETDEEHPLTANELCELLEQRYGIKAERKSIYADLNTLNEYGTEVQKTHYPRQGVFTSQHDFEPAELRMLMDAVQASSFISVRKTKKLLAKLGRTVSKYQAEDLQKHVFISKGVKSENEEIYYNIDKLQKAVNQGCKIKFTYHRRRIVNSIPVKDVGKVFTFSPYAMIWNSDKYYLVGNYEKYDNLSHFRIDRIRKITLLKEPVRPFCEVSEYEDVFDTADYASKLFNMYSGEEEQIELLCKNELLDVIIDRYGLNIPYKQVDREHFSVRIKVQISEGLIAWLMEFGGGIRVLEPKSLIDAARAKARLIAECYGVV
ncbi:MAG: WYL domain-containing protein [Oscillospiraceae bacterium]|jgi:predicted DNA-binding transcriptional regulator YafY|nr:WYL domain-containing protein [Oscillospiraceae bacterium]